MKKNVVIDGSTLSLLSYSHINGCGNQMGLLRGYKSKDVQDKISDSQIHTKDTHSYIYVSSFIPWPDLKFLRRRNGFIFMKDIHEAHAGDREEVIGWYSFRHQSSLRPSLKENFIHHQLTSLEEFEDNQDFLFFLCISSATLNKSTHSSSHSFLNYDFRTNRFKPVTASIRNLGDTSRSEYHRQNLSFMIHSPSSEKVMKNSVQNFVRPTGQMDQVIKMKQFAESISENLCLLQTQVNKSEADVSVLEDEVRYLRKKMAHLETKDMSSTFYSKQKRLKEEEEKSLRIERLKESDEEEQINKLLSDLGLSTDIASSLLPKSEERTRKLSQDQDTLISWEKMEVNPLYASTLDNALASSLKSDLSSALSDLEKERLDGAPFSRLQSNSKSENKEGSSIEISEIKSDFDREKHKQNEKKKPGDPFDFVNQVLSSNKAEVVSNKTNTVTINSGPVLPPLCKETERELKDQLQFKRETRSSNKQHHLDVNRIGPTKGTRSQIQANDSEAVQDPFTSTLSSSPTF